MDQEGGPGKCYYELNDPSHMHNDARKIRLSEICKAPLLTEEYRNAQKHCTGPEEALNVQHGPRWETNSQKVILALEEDRKKNEFMVHVQFKARSQVPVLHPTSGCQRDSVQWMARETAPSWISPLQGSDGVVFSQWFSETARMETGKAKYLCPNPSSLCYITSQLC